MVVFNIQYYYPKKLDTIILNDPDKDKWKDPFSDLLVKRYDELIKDLSKVKKVVKVSDAEKIVETEQNKKKRPMMPYYYYAKSPTRARYTYHVYTPGGIEVIRVPSTILGANVLGRAFIGTNRVEILETLSGLAFEEVKKHEINHILHPYLGELQIKQKTRSEI